MSNKIRTCLFLNTSEDIRFVVWRSVLFAMYQFKYYWFYVICKWVGLCSRYKAIYVWPVFVDCVTECHISSHNAILQVAPQRPCHLLSVVCCPPTLYCTAIGNHLWHTCSLDCYISIGWFNNWSRDMHNSCHPYWWTFIWRGSCSCSRADKDYNKSLKSVKDRSLWCQEMTLNGSSWCHWCFIVGKWGDQRSSCS